MPNLHIADYHSTILTAKTEDRTMEGDSDTGYDKPQDGSLLQRDNITGIHYFQAVVRDEMQEHDKRIDLQHSNSAIKTLSYDGLPYTTPPLDTFNTDDQFYQKCIESENRLSSLLCNHLQKEDNPLKKAELENLVNQLTIELQSTILERVAFQDEYIKDLQFKIISNKADMNAVVTELITELEKTESEKSELARVMEDALRKENKKRLHLEEMVDNLSFQLAEVKETKKTTYDNNDWETEKRQLLREISKLKQRLSGMKELHLKKVSEAENAHRVHEIEIQTLKEKQDKEVQRLKKADDKQKSKIKVLQMSQKKMREYKRQLESTESVLHNTRIEISGLNERCESYRQIKIEQKKRIEEAEKSIKMLKEEKMEMEEKLRDVNKMAMAKGSQSRIASDVDDRENNDRGNRLSKCDVFPSLFEHHDEDKCGKLASQCNVLSEEHRELDIKLKEAQDTVVSLQDEAVTCKQRYENERLKLIEEIKQKDLEMEQIMAKANQAFVESKKVINERELDYENIKKLTQQHNELSQEKEELDIKLKEAQDTIISLQEEAVTLIQCNDDERQRFIEEECIKDEEIREMMARVDQAEHNLAEARALIAERELERDNALKEKTSIEAQLHKALEGVMNFHMGSSAVSSSDDEIFYDDEEKETKVDETDDNAFDSIDNTDNINQQRCQNRRRSVMEVVSLAKVLKRVLKSEDDDDDNNEGENQDENLDNKSNELIAEAYKELGKMSNLIIDQDKDMRRPESRHNDRSTARVKAENTDEKRDVENTMVTFASSISDNSLLDSSNNQNVSRISSSLPHLRDAIESPPRILKKTSRPPPSHDVSSRNIWDSCVDIVPPVVKVSLTSSSSSSSSSIDDDCSVDKSATDKKYEDEFDWHELGRDSSEFIAEFQLMIAKGESELRKEVGDLIGDVTLDGADEYSFKNHLVNDKNRSSSLCLSSSLDIDYVKNVCDDVYGNAPEQNGDLSLLPSFCQPSCERCKLLEKERDILTNEMLDIIDSAKQAGIAEAKAIQHKVEENRSQIVAFMCRRYRKMKLLYTWRLFCAYSRRYHYYCSN